MLEEDVELRWMEGSNPESGRMTIEQLDEERVEEWSDGSRANGLAAGATWSKGLYLGE